jgi:hypothetical protein
MARVVRGSASQQEVFEQGAAARVVPGPVLRPTDSSRRVASENVVSPALAVNAARQRFADVPLEWDSLGSATNTRTARLGRLLKEAQALLEEEDQAGASEALPVAALSDLRKLHERWFRF